MSINVRSWLLGSVAVLLVCGLPFFTRVWLAPPEAAARRPLPVASPTPPAAAAVPTPVRSETAAEPTGRERPPTENGQFKQANTALEAARQKAEADKKRAEQSTQMMAALNIKLLDANLKVPQTVAEAATLMGQNLADAALFKQRWGDAVQAYNTLESGEYLKEQDELVTQSAALLKFMSDEKNAALFKQPDNVAQFQSVSLAGALGLRDDQTQAVNTALDGYYQQFFTQGLNTDAQPETGFDAWHQQRLALSEQAYAAVAALLTPEQAAAFHGIYPDAGIFMFHVTFGGLPGVSSTL